MPKAPKGSNNSSQKKTAPQKGNANGSNKPMSANGAGGGNNANAKKNAAIDDSDVVDEFSFEFTAEDIRRMLMDKTGNMFSSLSTVMGTGAVAAAAAANFHNPASGGTTNANANHHDGPGLPPDETAFLMNQLRKQAASNAKGTKTPAEIDAATSPAAFEDFFRYMYTALQRSGGADNNKGVALPPPTSNATKATAATGLPSANQSQAAINTKNRLSQNKLINPSLLTPKQQAAAAAAAKAAGAAVNDFEDDEDESDTDAADALARLAGKSKAFRVDPSGDNGDDDGVDDEDGGSYAPEIQSLLRELQQANLAELDAVIAQTVAAADGKKSIQPAEEVDDEDEFEDDELVGSKGKKNATKGGGGPLGRKRGGTGPSFEDLDAQSQMNILQLYPELISRMSQRSAAAVTANTMAAGGKMNAGGKMEMPTSLPAEHELALLALAALTGKTSVTAAAVQRSYEKSKLVGTNAAATLAAAQHVVSQFQNPNGTFNPNTAATATAADQQRQYSNADLDSDEHSYNDSNADDGMPDDGDILHKEDLRQINTLMDRLEPLTLDTVHELCQEWGVPTKSSPSETAGTPESRSNDHLFFSTSIAERMRYLSAAVVVCVAERFHHLHNSSPMCRDAKERTTMISNLVLRLGKSLKELDPKVRANFSTVFGFTTPSPSAEEVCVAVMCVGIVAFFQPVSIATLERVCEEFGINDYPQLLTDCDPDFIHDILANRLCEYFYPEIRTLARNFNASSLLSILTIHENGPGSYTCHIDNASLIGVVPKQMTISNTYNCKKMKWRAQVVLNTDQALSFITWHHHPSTYRIRATVRSSNAPKVPGLSGQNAGGGKKGNANQAVDANATPAIPQNTNNAAEWSIPPQHIYVSVEGVVLPGQRFVIDKVVPLDIAYAALTTLQPNNGTGGSVLRIYNRPDDRLTLQFSLEILEVLESHVPPPVATATPKALNVKADGATVQELMVADAKAELKLKQEREKQEAAAAKAAKDAADKEKADQAAAAAAAAAAEAAKKKKEPPLTKAQLQTLAKQAALEKKIKTLEGLEDTGRERNAAAELAAWVLLDSEIKKSHEKKFAKQREREKKLVEELSKPDPNLQTQLSQLQQTVHAARTAVTKQNQDRTKDLKDLERLREQLGRRSKELESLRKLFDDQQAQLEEAEDEIVEVERRTAEKEAVINRREETRRLRAWDDEAPNMGGGGNNNGPQRHQQGNNNINIPLVADPTASLLTFNPSSQQHTTGKQNRSSGHHSQSATAGLSSNGRNGSNTFASNNNSNNNATNNANVTRFWADAANDAVFNPNTTQTNTSNNSRNGNGTPVSLSNNNGNNFGNSFSNSPAVLPPQSNPTPQQQQQQQGRNGRNGSTQQMASTPSSQTNRGGNNNASQQQQQRNASSLFGFDSTATSLAPPSPAGGSTSNAGFSLGPQSVGAVSPTPQNGHGNVQLKSGAKEWVPASSFSVTAGDSHTDSFEVTSAPQSGFTVTSSPGLPPSSGSATNPNAVPFVPRGMSMGNGQRSNSNNNASGSNSAAQRGGSAVSLTMGSANSVYQLQQQLQMSGMGSGGGNSNNAAPGMLGMGGGVGLGGSVGGGYNGGGPIGLPDPYMRQQDMYGGGSPSMLGGYDNMIGPMGGSNQQQIGGGYGGGSGMHMGSGGFSNQGLGLGYGGMGGNSMDGLGLGIGPMGSGGAIGGSNGAIGQGAGAPGGDSGFQLTANAVNAGGLMIRQQQQQYQQPPYPSNSRTGSLYWGQQ